MTTVISEKEELEKLQEKYVNLMTQIKALEKENENMTSKLTLLDIKMATHVIESKTEDNFNHASLNEHDDNDDKFIEKHSILN